MISKTNDESSLVLSFPGHQAAREQRTFIIKW